MPKLHEIVGMLTVPCSNPLLASTVAVATSCLTLLLAFFSNFPAEHLVALFDRVDSACLLELSPTFAYFVK